LHGPQKIHEFFRLLSKCATKYGNIFRLWVGQRPFVFLYSAEAIQPIYQHSLFLCNRLELELDKPHFKVTPYAKLCALDIICDTAMGSTINAQENSQSEYVTAVDSLSEIVQRRFITPWLKPDFLFKMTKLGKKQEQCLKIVHNFTRRGHDTIASGVSWILYVLGHHLDSQEKIVEEFKNVTEEDNTEWPTMKHLNKLCYLEGCIKEAMRLYPVVPLIARNLTQPIKIMDYMLPEGVTILINTYLLHRDSRFFPNPDIFEPDRFLTSNCEARNPFAYVPFSAGPRNCIGQKFAMMELKIILSTVLQRFIVKSVDKEERLKLVGELVLLNRDGIRLTITART
ncbi:hypothetical protein L9F63_025560, partial [Diploptera punctata]